MHYQLQMLSTVLWANEEAKLMGAGLWRSSRGEPKMSALASSPVK